MISRWKRKEGSSNKTFTSDAEDGAHGNILLVAYAERDREPVITKLNRLWITLNASTEIGDEERQVVPKWKARLEEPFREEHRTGRGAFQEVYKRYGASKEKVNPLSLNF